MTLQAGLDLPTPPAGQSLPWAARWEPVLGDSVGGVVVVLVLALVAGGAGAALAAKAHERRPAFPVQYAPPPGSGPRRRRT